MEENKSDIKSGKFITDVEDVSRIKKNLYDNNVYKINFHKKNFRKMKYLSKIVKICLFNNSLVKLSLTENNIRSIKYLWLANSKLGTFSNLKYLDLSRNNLENYNIKYIRKLNCKNLKDLFLYCNWFTDLEVFNAINENFGKHLRILKIGFNRFEDKTQLKECNFPELKIIGLNYVFSKKNYENLIKLKMKNLEEFYIQNNGIVSLVFLDQQTLPKLREIYLANNEIEVINTDVFLKFPSLERIFIDNSVSKIVNINKINNIKNFKYYVMDNIGINLEIIKKKGINMISGLEI